MWTAKWILDEYEESNEKVRWEFYMLYRDLRSCFEGIEVRQENISEETVEKVTEKPAGTWFSHWARLVKG